MDRRLGNLLAMVVVASLAGEQQVASAAVPRDSVLARQVGRHRFIAAVGIPNPFLSTFVRSNTGLATTQGMKVGFYNFADPPQLLGNEKVDLMYLSQGFTFQQRVSKKVAVRLAMAGAGRLGTDTPALLTEGVSAIVGLSGGATWRIAERPGFQLAASADAATNSLTAVRIRSFVEDVLANGLSDTTNSPVEGLSNLQLTTGLRAAWGRSDMLGYLLYGDIGYQDPYERGDPSQFYWQAGGAVSLDLHQRWKPDMGFVGGLTYRSDSGRNDDLGAGGWDSNLGVFYTGRPELTLGLQMLYTRLKQEANGEKFGAFGIVLVLGFDFS